MIAKLNPLQTSLPQSGQLSDGTWVSNYNLLPSATLAKEGWMEAVEVKPVLAEGEHYEFESAAEVDGKVLLTYKAVDNPPDPLVVAQAELDRYKQAVAEVTAINTSTALKTTLVDAVNRLKVAVAEPIVKEITL